MTKTIYIIRHGETDFNKQNIVQGSGVDMPLNEKGRWQAEQFYNAYKNHPFQVVYTSALVRSQQSVAKFIEQGIKHIALPELNEISWGDFEGKQQTPVQRETYWRLIEQWNKGELNAKIPNGESPIEMQARQQGALNRIQASTEEEILICMHGRAMKSFLCLLLNEPLTQMEKFQHTNLCLYQLQIEDNTTQLLKTNDTSHLHTMSQ
ncbi:MAG: histidine phosphatase family protein [Bacteroidia bacterium]|jgi:probable phosphoglycerate mutase|nr:histidine phosphatase family protein [Bacteroidia bacterium]